MADEKTFTISGSVSKGGAKQSIASRTYKRTMTGTHVAQDTQSITSSAAVLAIPAAVTTPLDLIVENLDASIEVELYREVGATNLITKVPAGGACVLHGLNVKPYAKTASGTALIQYSASDV